MKYRKCIWMVPRDIVPRLVQLCEENPQDTLEGRDRIYYVLSQFTDIIYINAGPGAGQ